MLLEIISPDKEIFKGEVSSVKLPGADGSFEVLNNHAPIVSTLVAGDVRVINAAKETENFAITGGVIEMQDNKIVVLAD
ncbi:MAG: F-type H+-transporting ATPase subunit epsilon [Flavobacteriales bacterium]|jgi:F-type H+-transporting ATPase subunit epsilon